MNPLPRILVAAGLAAVMAGPALARSPADARITFSGGSVAFLAGVNWGGGTLTYRGHRYPIQVNGLSVGAVGASKYRASGVVYHLRRLADIEGTYGAVEGGMTAGPGQGGMDMRNDKGVVISTRSSSSGLKLTFAPTGVQIKLKH
jgi:outer membrane immunogenic protein